MIHPLNQFFILHILKVLRAINERHRESGVVRAAAPREPSKPLALSDKKAAEEGEKKKNAQLQHER